MSDVLCVPLPPPAIITPPPLGEVNMALEIKLTLYGSSGPVIHKNKSYVSDRPS